jgi:alpha-N-arabinofuranosidase
MLVNSMAPIRAEKGGPAWRQTSFYPYALTAHHVAGDVLDVKVTSDTYQTALHGQVPLVDVVATHDLVGGTVTVLIVNRSRTDAAPVRIGFAGFEPSGPRQCWTLAEGDPRLTNSPDAPDRVAPRANTSPTLVGTTGLTLQVPPVSWTLLSLSGRVVDVFAASGG